MLDNSDVFIKSLKPMIVNLAQSLAQDCKTGWRNTGEVGRCEELETNWFKGHTESTFT